jgi:hypothetical protein
MTETDELREKRKAERKAKRAKRVHLGQGARKAARRKFRHALLEKQYKHFRRLRFTPAAARFHARMRTDQILAEGTTDTNAHGHGLVKRA